MPGELRRGQLYFITLDPVIGREIGTRGLELAHTLAEGLAPEEIGPIKRRPVVVLSINWLNRRPLVGVVVPGSSSRPPREYRNVVAVRPSRINGLTIDTYFQCHQLRAVDHSRFLTEPVGWLSANDLRRIEQAVAFVLGLDVFRSGMAQ